MSRLEPDGQQRHSEEERQNPFDRLVRVEPVDGSLAEGQAETARDSGSEQVPAQECDSVRARALAADDGECRCQR